MFDKSLSLMQNPNHKLQVKNPSTLGGGGGGGAGVWDAVFGRSSQVVL